MRLAACALVLALSGCAGPSMQRAEPAHAGGALVIVGPQPDHLPFDPRGARLVEALGQLSAMVGHPVVFELDAALLPEYRVSFEEELIRSIENAARDLARLKKTSERVFQRSAGLLERIACRYEATARGPRGIFDSAARTVVVTKPPQAALVEPGVVLRALQEEFESYLDQQYRARAPEQVPPGEWGAYFEYLTMTRPGYGNLWERRLRNERADSSPLDKLANDPHAETILRLTRLAELAPPHDATGVLVREWLARQASWFEAQYGTQPERFAALPASCPWRRSEQAYVRWLSANASALPDDDKLALARVLFPARGSCRAGQPCPDQPEALPGFDRLGFGFAVVEQWRADGRPTAGDTKRFELQDELVCPHTTGPDGRRERTRSCGRGFYHQAMATEASRARLVRELAARADAGLVDEVFANSDLVPPERVIALWRGLEPHASQWQAASRAIAEHLLLQREHEGAIVQEAKRLWRDSPQRRGTALFILAHTTRGMDRHYADPRWAEFARDYGAPVSQQVFASFLDHGPAAVKLAPVIWPALAPGFSRAEPLVARLDRFMQDPSVRAGRGDEPGKSLRAIAGRMCGEPGAQDLPRLHQWLQQRARAHPQEAPALATLIQDTERCREPAQRSPGT
jgi:hypothetical protein